MKISEITYSKLEKAKEKEILIKGYKSTQIEKDFNNLLQGKSVEVGYRLSSGAKDRTLKVYEEWLKLIKQLKKDGFIITEENVKHDNKSPTLSNGFWDSKIYKLDISNI